MKKRYESPLLYTELLSDEDVIVTSSGSGNGNTSLEVGEDTDKNYGPFIPLH